MRYVKRIMVLFAMLFFIPIAALAGDISGGVSPTTAGGGAMNTLEDIYNLINLGTTNSPRATAFVEPAVGPFATGHTLTEVYERAKTSSRPAKTGQTPTVPIAAPVGSDGNLQKGVTWPSPRFTDNLVSGTSNGTVTDNLTGLIWLKVANYNSTTSTTGTAAWDAALTFCNALHTGQCGLTDGSAANDWLLPNLRELQSLIDYANAGPALPTGHPFTGVQLNSYWSSTTLADPAGFAWRVHLGGSVVGAAVAGAGYVWPVRGGQS
jgi:hypothetical protein